MKINGREIGPGKSPYIIAEIGASHCGSYERAVLLMGAAMGAGADAVKFQCYTPDSITIDSTKADFIIKDGPWKGRTLYELYQKAHTPLQWFPDLFAVAKRYNAAIFASVFDKASVDFLEKLDCPAYKIASMEIVDIPLIEYTAETGKPIILSTGMATDDEVGQAGAASYLDYERSAGTLLLHCVSGYPSRIEEANLDRMRWLKPMFMTGISDHTPGWEIPVAATAMGAVAIEKHIRLSDDTTSEDAGFALDSDQFRKMCQAVRSIWGAMQPSEAKSEESSRQLRRSLYVTANMKKDELFTEENLRSIRPSYGLLPKHLPDILGKRASKDIERGTALAWDLIAS